MEVEQEEEHFQLVATRVASVPRETSASTRQNVLQPTVIFYRSLRHFSKISDEPDPESFCHGFGRFNYYCQISFQTYYANSASAARSPPTQAQTSCTCLVLVYGRSMDVARFLQTCFAGTARITQKLAGSHSTVLLLYCSSFRCPTGAYWWSTCPKKAPQSFFDLAYGHTDVKNSTSF